MKSGFVGARDTIKKEGHERNGVKINLHFGIFFDGTNNNKYQSMIGKYFYGDGLDADFGYENTRDKRTQEEYFIENSNHSADLYIDTNYDVKNKDFNDEVRQNFELYERIKQSYIEGQSTSDNDIEDAQGALAQGATYTNVAILDAIFKNEEDGNDKYFPIYVEGVGTDMELTEDDESLQQVKQIKNQALGTGDYGVEEKVNKAINAIRNICTRYIVNVNIDEIEIKMYVFGFSRGATEARMFAFRMRQETSLIQSKKVKERPKLIFGGLFDTVASVGINHQNNNQELGLWGIDFAEKVLHLCAMDEFRKYFALTDIQNCLNKGVEFFMPGCHTDIGGGVTLGLEHINIKINSSFEKDTETLETYFMREWGAKSESNPVSVGLLDKMGWINMDNLQVENINFNDDQYVIDNYNVYREDRSRKSINTFYNYIEFRKYTKPGYSNIALALMHSAVLSFNIFGSIPIAYCVPDELKDLYDKWVKQIVGIGRRFASIEEVDYKHIRDKYLHFSMTDGYINAGATRVVNGPFYQDMGNGQLLITRKVYRGEEGSSDFEPIGNLN